MSFHLYKPLGSFLLLYIVPKPLTGIWIFIYVEHVLKWNFESGLLVHVAL